MWITPYVLLTIVCSWGSAESRESLRDQLAMLRREQWRDKERIEALERKVVVREERGSSPHALGDVLEEIQKEVEKLTDELKGRQELEAAVEAVQGKVEKGLSALKEMAVEVGNVKNEQKRMWREITALRNGNKLIEYHIEKKETTSRDPFSEEGSGDLASESLLPVGETLKEIHEAKRGSQNQHNLWEEQKIYLRELKQQFNEERINLIKQLNETQTQVQQTQNHCTQVVSNVTEKFLTSTSLVENLEERFSRLRRDVSRLEFNIAQAQGSLDVVAHDRATDKARVRDLKDEWSRARIHLDQQRDRLTNLELLTTNLTLQRCKVESQVAQRELKVANMELWLAQADRRLDETARRTELTRRSDENMLRSLREAVVTVSRKAENTTIDIQQLISQQVKVEKDLEKFVRQLPKDCSLAPHSRISLIHVNDLGPIEVFCDADTEGGPWLILQRRFNGSENFFRSWAEYQAGFGSLSTEFWLGNEILHRITNSQPSMKLRIDMWDIVGRYIYAEYDKFSVKSEEELYALEVGRHKGNVTDALRHHNGMGFSTHDRDNDASSTHCAVHYTGGWWYQHCHRADLNGRYALGMTWYDEFSRDWIQLQRVEMKMARATIST